MKFFFKYSIIFEIFDKILYQDSTLRDIESNIYIWI